MRHFRKSHYSQLWNTVSHTESIDGGTVSSKWFYTAIFLGNGSLFRDAVGLIFLSIGNIQRYSIAKTPETREEENSECTERALDILGRNFRKARLRCTHVAYC